MGGAGSIQKVWSTEREQIAKGELTCGFGRTSIAGTFTIEAILWTVPMPLGTVWFQFVDTHTISIAYSFVFEGVRRTGVRTFLHHQLLAAYPDIEAIVTGAANEFSKPWLLKMGFKEDRHGHWSLRIKRPRLRKKAT